MFSSQYIENYKKTFQLAYPVCLSQLGHVMVGVVDTAMVGYIGTTEQAAAALANSFYVLALVLGLGISTGLTPLVAIADGEGNKTSISKLLINGLLVNLLTGLSLFVIAFLCSPVLYEFKQVEKVAELAVPFFNVMILSTLPLSIFSTFKQFAEGLSDTKAAMIISLAANLVNVLLNYILMFGKSGFQPMGMMGACWASFWSRVIMAICMLLYVYYNQRFKAYWKDARINNISFPLIKTILSIGIPSGLQWIFEISAFSFAVVMAGWIGEKEQAAHQVAISMAAVTYMIASGLSAAACVRVGNQLGAKNKDGIRIAGFSSFIMVIGFMFIAALIFIIYRNYFPLLFSTNEEVIAIASSLLIIAALFQLSDGVQVVGLGVLRGLKDVKIPTMVTVISYWVIGIPISYILAFKLKLGVEGIWYGLFLGLSVTAVSLFTRFNVITKHLKMEIQNL